MMIRLLVPFCIAASCIPVSFAAGLMFSHAIRSADASEMGVVPQLIDVAALSDMDLGNPVPGLDLRSKTYLAADGMTLSVQTGNVPKHVHAESNEIQYVVEGSGTFWLGDKIREIHAGDLIIIPKGVAHSGAVPTSGKFKVIAIKTPPQPPGDTRFVN